MLNLNFQMDKMTQLESHSKRIYAKVMLMLVLSIFLISSVRAFEFDNVKSYDSATKEMVVSNAFGLGADIGKAKLTTPRIVEVAQGYQKVGEFELWSYEDYANALKGFKVIDAKTNQEVNRTFDLLYKSYQNISIDDYTETCNTSGTGAYKNIINCSKTKSGNHTEQVEVWNKLGADLSKEDHFTIGIFTNVKAGDYHDWVINLFGVETTEWAIWKESLRAGLRFYYAFDNEVAGNNATDWSGNNNTGLNSGTTGRVAGKIRHALNVSGASNYITSSLNLSQSANDNYSVAFWTYLNSISSTEVLELYGSTSKGEQAMILDSGGIQYRWNKNGVGGFQTGITPNLSVWDYHIIIVNDTGVKWYINSNLAWECTSSCRNIDANQTMKIGSDATNYVIGNLDEYAMWARVLNITEVGELYNNGAGLPYDSMEGTLTATLSAPVNIFNTTSATINLSANFTGSPQNNISSVKVLVYDSANNLDYSNTDTGNYNASYNKTWTISALTDDIYKWAVFGYGNNGINASTSNRTFTIDTTAPSVVITNPLNNLSTLNIPLAVGLNATISDNILLSNCFYDNETANVSLTCGNNASINLIGGTHTLRFYANDSAGNLRVNSTTFFINFINTSVNYTPSVYERDNHTINLTINANAVNSLSGNITYNGTAYTMTSGINNATNGILLINLTAPSVNTNTIVMFNITYNINGDNFTIYNFNQTIINYQAINVSTSCQAGFMPSYNFTLFDEVNRTNVSGSANYNFKYGTIANNTENEFFGNLSGISSFSLCINSTNFNSYRVGYGEVQYTGTGYTLKRYYLFENSLLTNDTINVSLFNMYESDATSFLFSVQDKTSLDPYVNAYLTLLRWYPQVNRYDIVEMGKTDDKGETIFRVNTEDIDYKTGVYFSNGTLIELTNPVRFICLTAPCTYNLKIEQTPLDYTDIFGVSSNLSYDNNTKVFRFVWNDPSQHTSYMNLTIFKLTGDNDTILCTTGSSGFSGSITCNVSQYSGQFRAIAYRSASPSRPIAELITNAVEAILNSKVGLFISIVLIILIVLMGIFSPVVALILSIVALIPALILGAINLAILIGFAVLVFIVLWVLRRND